MNLYLVETKKDLGYDSYDSMVVASSCPKSAVAYTIAAHSDPDRVTKAWPWDHDEIKCKQIGTSETILEEQIICASYHAS